MILEELLQDEYDRIVLNTKDSDKPEEVDAVMSILIVYMVKFAWLGFTDKNSLIARLLRLLPNKH